MQAICSASRQVVVLAHELLTTPYAELDAAGLEKQETLLDIPGPDAHPVMIARHMLRLASHLQHLHPVLHTDIRGLVDSTRAIIERVADLAINLVATNDDLLGSLEGLECVLLESVYHANVGNLRRSWVASRRALTIAQLMGLNRAESDCHVQYKVLDPSRTKHHPQLIWLRIVFLDRHLSLMLGLPQGSSDRSMASETLLASDTPMGRLDRLHCVIASRILERNESRKSGTPLDVDFTRSVDAELQQAARFLPSRWWLTPTFELVLSRTAKAEEFFWETRRLFAQVYHYNLLNQLHLPYVLGSPSLSEEVRRRQEYSRTTCVNASREMLSRFVVLRSYNQIASSCRSIDFLALMAALTLLLVHLDSRTEADNPLAHQYVSDRAMIERVQENMEEVNRLNSDALSAQSAQLLSRLLAIDGDNGEEDLVMGDGDRVSVTGSAAPDPDAIVSVHIPYFLGTVKITRKGVTKERHGQESLPITSTISTHSPERTTLPTSQASFSDQSISWPDIAAGNGEWAFQGVDWAFFDSLINDIGTSDG